MINFNPLKKIELHLHLEGAADPDFVREICIEQKKGIPDVFTKSGNYKWSSFKEFLKIYEMVTELFLIEENFAKLVRHVLEKQVKSNIIYSEIFLGLHLWGSRKSGKWVSFLKVANIIAKDFEEKYNIHCRFIIVAIRHLGPDKAIEAVEFAADSKEFRVVGFGMAGDENAYETSLFLPSFQIAKRAKLELTSHAGEVRGPESIKQAIDLGVSRIGHGVRAVEDKALLKRLLDENIMLEICPGSNVSLGIFESLSEHPIELFYKLGLSLSISTDDPPFFNTSLDKEYLELYKTFGWDYSIFKKINFKTIDYAFCDKETKKKLKIQIID